MYENSVFALLFCEMARSQKKERLPKKENENLTNRIKIIYNNIITYLNKGKNV